MTATGVTLNGTVNWTADVPTKVYVFWGTQDETTNMTAWENVEEFGEIGVVGALETNVLVSSNGFYFYRFYASNDVRGVWAGPSEGFQTGVILVEGTDTNSTELPGNTGEFTVMRPNETSAGEVTVNILLGGTATEGVDYENIGATVTLPAGVTSVTVTVTPIDEDVWGEGDETVRIYHRVTPSRDHYISDTKLDLPICFANRLGR